MAKKKTVTPHHHIWNLPKKVFPRKKGNKAKDYASAFGQLHEGLTFSNKKVQESATIAVFHLKAVTKKDGYRTNPAEVLMAIDEFMYHYENFCYRAYALREKFLKFINSVIPIGYPDDMVQIRHMVLNPVVAQTKLLTEIEKFNEKKALGKIIKDRKLLTHQLYYTDVDSHLRPKHDPKQPFPQWVKNWRREVETRAQRVERAMSDVVGINHNASAKVLAYKAKH
jgi:hypothetical protein